MVLLERFFFWFSVRIGSIIVGTISLIQSSIWMMVAIISAQNPDELSNSLRNLVATLSIKSKVFLQFVDEPRVYLIVLIVFFLFLVVSCVLVITGAYRCNHYLLYPFLVLDFLYMLLVLIIHIFLMMYLKEKEYGIGLLILYSNLGALIILILFYMWMCVLSLLQIIKELRNELIQRTQVKRRNNQVRHLIETHYRF